MFYNTLNKKESQYFFFQFISFNHEWIKAIFCVLFCFQWRRGINMLRVRKPMYLKLMQKKLFFGILITSTGIVLIFYAVLHFKHFNHHFVVFRAYISYYTPCHSTDHGSLESLKNTTRNGPSSCQGHLL